MSIIANVAHNTISTMDSVDNSDSLKERSLATVPSFAIMASDDPSLSPPSFSVLDMLVDHG